MRHFLLIVLYNKFEDKKMKIIFLIALFCTVLAIYQSCVTSQQCPQNAYCQQNDMCACNTDFIGACNISAYYLTESSTNVVLNSNTITYFYVNPEQLDTYIEITFQICLNQVSQVNTVLTLWGQLGNNTAYNLSNALGNPTSAILTQGCQQFTTPYITFTSQPNGQNQMLVLGITDISIPASISISAQQQQSSGAFIYYYIIVAIVVVVIVVIIVGVVVFLVRRRRLRLNLTFAQGVSPAAGVGGPVRINIDHFQNMMPSLIAQNLGSQKLICSICLQQVERNEMVRQTPCKHTFHSTCIDSWCLKNLSCPVCRTDLTYQNMMELSRKNSYEASKQVVQLNEKPAIQPAPISAAIDVLINKEQEINTQQAEQANYINFDEQKYQIRQHML